LARSLERHERDPQEQSDGYRALIPAGRWGVPMDVAGAVVFLASEASSFMTGQNLCVTGGMDRVLIGAPQLIHPIRRARAARSCRSG
jgi:NAD(P)-dependent dehydrogenase (short-subunit alcohol dehydrogenase family)